MDKKNIQVKLLLLKETSSHQNQNFSWLKSMSTETFSLFYHNLTIFSFVFQIKDHKTLKDLTVLPTEFFRRCKTHIPSVIILPTESKTEMIRR